MPFPASHRATPHRAGHNSRQMTQWRDLSGVQALGWGAASSIYSGDGRQDAASYRGILDGLQGSGTSEGR